MNPNEYNEAKLRMTRLSRSFGIAAIVSAFVLMSFPYIGMGFGALSILFALLSRGYGNKLDKDSQLGVTLSAIAICVSLFLTISSLFLMYTDNDMKAALYEYAEEIDSAYGDELEETYGENMEGMLDSMFGGSENE